jgi:IS5 family transposase
MSYLGHVLMENRSGLPVAARVTDARPQGEWEAALEMAAACHRRKQITVAGDKAYDDAEFVRRARELGITPHVQKNDHERHHSNLDGRTTRHPGYSISLQKRKRIEHIFAWLKTI